jgi:elongation factor 1-gamma
LPLLETADGQRLFESNAIAFYLANEQLRGSSPSEQAQIVQWTSFADSELLPPVATLVFTASKVITRPAEETAASEQQLSKLLSFIDASLNGRSYLVGQQITLADLAVIGVLIALYQQVQSADQRAKYVNLNKWFDALIAQPQFVAALGDLKLKKAVVAAAAAASPAGDEFPTEPKKKDPFAAFPAGTFVMDAFKREYSNKSEDESIAWFWQNFDKENYSIWSCEYLFPEELKMVFMSCNLIGGMMQRLDTMRKHAFGSMCLFGEDNDSTISGIWIWRGHELAFNLSSDWQVDYESYKWTKLDASSEETRKMVDEYLRWEGDFGGKKFNQGKIFK